MKKKAVLTALLLHVNITFITRTIHLKSNPGVPKNRPKVHGQITLKSQNKESLIS